MTLLELLKQKKQDLAAGSRRKTIKPVPGTGRYRILPSWRGAGAQFYHEFGQHYVKDASEKLLAIYLCTDKTFGKPCEVCDTLRDGSKNAAGDEFTLKLLKEAGAAGRYLVNVLHLDGPTPSEVQILELAPTAFEQIVNIAVEWEEAGDSIFDEVKGKDVLITRTGAGILTKYAAQVAAKTMPLPAGILAKLHNLDEYVKQESSEQKMRALNSVRSVAGLLSAPGSRPSGLPAAVAGAAVIDEDPYAVSAPPPKRVPPKAAEEDITDVPDFEPAPPPVKAKARPPAPVVEPTGDSELDELLTQLG